MARLPGKPIRGTSIRTLPCGCSVKFWRYSGTEFVYRCPEHQAQTNQRIAAHWAEAPIWKKALLVIFYGAFGVFFGTVVLYALAFILGFVVLCVRMLLGLL
jgi:membrane-associated protease RseP (regulator of RpoE activity)